MANPNPKTDHLEPYHFKQQGEEPLSATPIAVRLPQSADERIRAIPPQERSHLLREWILQGLNQMNPD